MAQLKSATQIRCIPHTAASPHTLDEPGTYYMTSVITGLVNGNRYYVEADIENYVGTSSLGISGVNMEDPLNYKFLRNSDGKVYVTFTYNDNKFTHGVFGELGEGIHFAKTYDSQATIKNIKCTNITSKIDDVTHIVNTSSTDRTQEITEIKTNLQVGTNPSTVIKYFYIHAQTVNGINYAVSSSRFNIYSSNAGITIGTLTDLGSGTTSAGYYGNVVQIELTIDYTAGNLFPNENVESYITVEGEPTLAIDQ